MAIRWTQKQYSHYLAKQGKKKQVKPVLKKVTPSMAELVPGGLRFVIYRVHPSLNDWTRWDRWKRAKVKKEWEEEIWAITPLSCRQLQLARASITITYYSPDHKRMDKDNYTPKFIMDGLVKAGILSDDNITVVNPEIRIKPAKDRRTEIEIKWQGGEADDDG